MAKQYVVNKYRNCDVVRSGRLLGQGSYAVVAHGFLNHAEIAIKAFKNQFGGTNLRNEINILSRISHANVIKIIGIIDEDFKETPRLLLEYLCNGSLAEFSQTKVLTEPEQLKLLLDTAKGMTYVHDMHIIHRDLAARNIILDTFRNAKVADFGFSVRSDTDIYHQSFCFTAEELPRIPYRHMPIEAIHCLRKFPTANHTDTGEQLRSSYSKSLDVYSYAVLVWELLNPGHKPFGNFDNKQKHETVEEIYNGKNPASFVNSSQSFLCKMMHDIFDCSAVSRPTFGIIRSVIEQYLANMQPTQTNVVDFKCPVTPQEFCHDVIFSSTNSSDCGCSGSSSSSCPDMNELEMQEVLRECRMDSAIVFQNVATSMADTAFGKAVLKKFGRPDLKLSGLKRLNSRSLAIGFKPRDLGKSDAIKNAIQAMVNDMRENSDVSKNGIKVIPIFTPCSDLV